MQTGGCHHHNPAIGGAHHGPGRRQGGEGFAQTHGIGQDSPAAGQQPARRRPLMGKQAAAIRKRLLESGELHQAAMGRQRRQGLLEPGEPLLQIGGHSKAMAELPPQHRRRLEGELPTAAPAEPVPPRTHSPQLRLRDRIEGQLQLNATGGPKTHQTALRRLRACGQEARRAKLILTTPQGEATKAIKCENCIARHIDIPATAGKLTATEPSGCTPGMRCSLRICAPNFVFVAGDNLSIRLLTKPAFTAGSHLNPSTTCCPRAVAG